MITITNKTVCFNKEGVGKADSLNPSIRINCCQGKAQRETSDKSMTVPVMDVRRMLMRVLQHLMLMSMGVGCIC